MEEVVSKKDTNVKITTKHRDIDGGYAWIILFAAFLCHGLGNGSRQIFGILYIEILDIYQAVRYLTSWIITLQVLHWGLMGKKHVYLTPDGCQF